MNEDSQHEAGPATPRPQHTPGPWHWVTLPWGSTCLFSAGDTKRLNAVLLADPSAGEYLPAIDVPSPDATLIAAAPDLLAACEAFLSPDGWDGSVLAAQMRAAVAKAEGRAEQ